MTNNTRNTNWAICPTSHLFQWDGEEAQVHRNVVYFWKHHYYYVNEDTVHTWGLIDATSSQVTVSTINQSGNKTDHQSLISVGN